MIYLDYSATTPVNNEVLETFSKVTKEYMGNPNSLHKLGLEAKKLIEVATKQIADILNVNEKEIIYTSGASEANNTAIKGICLKYQNRGKHIITTRLEHSSVIAPISYLQSLGFEIDFVDMDKNGQVDLEHLKSLIRDDTILVSIASVNSEVGVVQPIEEIGKILKEYNKLYFHSDITQAIGKVDVNLENVDLASFSAQKIYGIKGIGALIKKEKIVIEPLIHGGKSTTIYRSGTPAVGLIVSLAKALRLVEEKKSENYQHVDNLNKYLKEKLEKNKYIHINSNHYCSPYILNFSIKNIKPETMLHALEEDDIYISTQTACSTGTKSIAVYEVTKNDEFAKHSVRVSLSHLTTKDEIDIFLEKLNQKIEGLEKLNESN